MESYGPPGHQTFQNLPVEAFQHPLLDVHGGPVLTDPRYDRYRHLRSGRPSDSFTETAEFNARLSGSWIYLGPKYHHFGHIMSEMVHRIVPSVLAFPAPSRYLLVTTFDDPDTNGFADLCRTFRQVLEFCEIPPQDVHIINENSVVEQLSICEQGSHLGGRASSWYLDTLEDFSTRRLNELHGRRPSWAKVYVSKSRIPHGGTILGESYIEELLRAEGFFILHPQEQPLSVQMDVYRKARVLVFSEGSACHGTELLGRSAMEETHVLLRRPEMRPAMIDILGERSRRLEIFQDTFLLGTIAVHPQTRQPHSEFAVSLLDIDRFVAYFRERGIARLGTLDVARYLEAAERDLKAYFDYHMHSDIAAVDAWRAGEVRLDFERQRRRFTADRIAVSLQPVAAEAGVADIEAQAWTAHTSRKWAAAARSWECFRERLPDSPTGFTLGSIALIELGRFYEADALLQQAMTKFPDHHEVHGNYGLVAHHRRDWREAVGRWEAYRGRFPDEVIGYVLGAVALCELERYAQADELVVQGLQHHPGQEELLEKYAWIAHLRADTEQACERLARLKAAYPGNPTAFEASELQVS